MWPLDDRPADKWVETSSEVDELEPEPAPVGLVNKIVAGADWCQNCEEHYLPILGVRGCPFCAP